MDVGFGLPPGQIEVVGELFWQGFSGKLARPLGGQERAKKFIAGTLDPSTLVTAVDQGSVLGAMVVTDRDHLSHADEWQVARKIYGTFGALPRLAMSAPLDTKPPVGALHIDWIAVSPHARGRGVGSKLMAFAHDVARQRGLESMTLDVVDSNPRARELYERLGFTEVSTKSVWPFRRLYGINSYTRMIRPVD